MPVTTMRKQAGQIADICRTFAGQIADTPFIFDRDYRSLILHEVHQGRSQLII